jgi:uncharacterized phiE125 gp8 family phage protein
MLTVSPDYVTTTVQPAEEPVSRTETKLHLRVDVTTDDTLIDTLIQAAREYVEKYTGRAFVRRTLRADLPYFDDCIRLPFAPAISISSVKYYNTDSPTVLTTLASSYYSLQSNKAIFRRNPGYSWPAVYPFHNAVQITYVAGYAPTSSPEEEAESVPAAIKAAIKLIVGDLYENREGQVLYPGQLHVNPTVNRLLDAYRVYQ